jgi:uncharacterized membrane protein YdjX (TVP38/TMEM64 family)
MAEPEHRARPERARGVSRWRLAPLVMLVAAAVATAALLGDRLTFESLAAHRAALLAFRDAHYLAAVAAFITVYALVVAFSLPGALIATLTGGFLFGLFPGVLYNVTAATLGAVAIFLAVRSGFGAALAERLESGGGAPATLIARLRENEVPVLFLMRLLPVVPFFLANLIPAMLGVSLARFAVTTFLGIMPGGLVYTWVGAGLGEVFEAGGSPDLGILFEPQILGPILALAALAALPILVKAVRREGR